MSDDLERDFMAPVEHLDEDCWCHHPRESHRFDPVRDYRELLCDECATGEEGGTE